MEEICSACKCNQLQTRISVNYAVYISALILYCMGISLSVRPVDQQPRQLAVSFYSKWYFAKSGIDVLARLFRLALNKYIIRESADKRNDFFEHVIL